MNRVDLALAAASVVLLGYGTWNGLVVAPPDRFMGDVSRIMYVHVPTAWNAMLCFTYAFVFAVASLLTRRPAWDHRMEAAVEVGLLLGILLTVQGSIWARPTWGVWWDWDPRLTSVAVMNVMFIGVIALRSFVDDASSRARWSSVATVLAFVNVPLVYMSVRWWRTLHQPPREAGGVDPAMLLPMWINVVGLLFLTVLLVRLRTRVARASRAAELAPPELP